MDDKRRIGDRRSEERHDVAGRIFWNKVGRNVSYVGWLSDASRTSASFVTSSSVSPAPGESVELKDLMTAPRRGTVARVSAYDRRLSLVVCNRLAAERDALTDEATDVGGVW